MIRPLLAVTFAAPCLLAQTTVQITSSRDSTLYESATGNLAGGACTGLFVGVTDQNNDALRRALVRFDVAAQIPAGAHIVAAELRIQVTRYNTNVDIYGHRALADWGEGSSLPSGLGGAGTAPTAPDATWIHSRYPSSNWTNPGGDFTAMSSLTIPAPSTGPATSTSTVAAVLDVQRWLDQPAQNFGWLLKTNEQQTQSALRFNSREASNNPPTLIVTYITNGQATTWGQGCTVGGAEFRHAWNGAPIGGTTVQFTQTNGPAGALAANLIALEYDRVGTALVPGCNLYLPYGGLIVTHSLVFLANNGSGSTSVTLPAGYPGVMFATQTAAIASTAAGFVFSNAAVALMQ
ncbi:MAG: DNRLRE domain-containing protein [Planctomycetes bacterium]|nr:DNRLRE domain-containing protein [Planctomycetota bacterium]